MTEVCFDNDSYGPAVQLAVREECASEEDEEVRSPQKKRRALFAAKIYDCCNIKDTKRRHFTIFRLYTHNFDHTRISCN